MTTSNYVLYAVAVGAILGAVAFFGLSPFGQSVVQQITQYGSPVGTTFNTAKVAAINITPSAIAASSTSMLNGDTSNRFITDDFWQCVGSNGQGLSVVAATTTIANLGLQGNANYIMANNFATTSTTNVVESIVASTTEGVLPGTSRVWPSGTYLTFVMGTTSNANFIGNTGTCTVGVHYLAS